MWKTNISLGPLPLAIKTISQNQKWQKLLQRTSFLKKHLDRPHKHGPPTNDKRNKDSQGNSLDDKEDANTIISASGIISNSKTYLRLKFVDHISNSTLFWQTNIVNYHL